jgi:hypothetical protein
MSQRDLQNESTWDLVSEVADRLQLKGRKRHQFVETCMSEAGFRRVDHASAWEKRDEETSGSENDWRERRRQERANARRRGDDWDEE